MSPVILGSIELRVIVCEPSVSLVITANKAAGVEAPMEVKVPTVVL